jgi:hypothetical protein
VTDGHGGAALDSIALEVRDLSVVQTGSLVAFYPMSGNAGDASGHGHDGAVNNAVLTVDRFGHANSAYAFNGTNSAIVVPNDTGLNFQKALSVNLWLTMRGAYANREQYPLSHGNWQDRWKLSISPVTNKLRFTVKNSLGQVTDLDGETGLIPDSTYNVTGVYSGSELELYLNGQLDAFTPFSGSINRTTVALTFGQDLPGDNNYSFDGTLDDIRIFDYALSLQEIGTLTITTVEGQRAPTLPHELALEQNYPNPFNPETKIGFWIPGPGAGTTGSGVWGVGTLWVRLSIYDILGREMAVLVDAVMQPGYHTTTWNAGGRASGVYICQLNGGGTRVMRKMVLVR